MSIGGPVDYRGLAERHRPQTAAGLRLAALDLLGNGLSTRDIGHALRLSEAAVAALLELKEAA